jgi:hypothetical protein
MLMRIEKSLVMMMLLLLFVSPLLQADQQASTKDQLAEGAARQSLHSNDLFKQRAKSLYTLAYELAERLISQPSLNEQQGIPVQAEAVFPEKTWCAQSGNTLKESLITWGKTSGWSIKWQSEYDYPVLAQVCFKGTFEQAMNEFIHAYKEAEYPLYLDIYPQQQLSVISH